MTHRHYCTYFDHRYLARGLALRSSLVEHSPDHTLWVLCLSIECEQFLRKASLPGIRIVPLADLESWDADLAATRSSRSLVEYYFTCSPCLPRYILATHPDVPGITYLDSDLFFFSSPEPVFSEISTAAIAIIPHRFSESRAAALERYGRYNVGWLTFDRSLAALACLDWWRERCIEWCFDRVEADRFADQKYLDRFPSLFTNVHVITNPGANLAPWNVANHSIQGDTPGVDGVPLVFYHFQGLKQIRELIFDAHLDDYSARLTRVIQDRIYRPYLLSLLRAQAFVQTSGYMPGRNEYLRGQRSGTSAFRETLRRLYATTTAAIKGNLIRIRSREIAAFRER